ncbi:signal peptidase II [Lacrimispora saccharolytica]|uniref:Peptidase A8 signal peptidase II n=1 Tax=Lacrimispora saccharolytica (strain ATCC 35040 / DSM 2544 / NRCC 2533 / WM1) TaxID=610130 RepID=D9R4P0_LACSW|nr:signal peptidase II [Lacrimispora saccharolytica]ADL03224.1 peptidase A8 signal peptidase II [[Clostridium] saccharolyticum WM1]QRV18598.1 signal peptidase II [Lacrimispora saccharolytica]
MVFISIIVLLASLDLLIKSAIEDQDEAGFPKELEGSGGKILLQKNHNAGFSFGCFKDHRSLVQMIPLAVASFIGGMLACLLQKKGNVWEKLALSVALGGAVSNLYDRLVRHYVVDYFSIQYGRLKKVVFNLGDMFIFLGAGIMLIIEIIKAFKEQ